MSLWKSTKMTSEASDPDIQHVRLEYKMSFMAPEILRKGECRSHVEILPHLHLESSFIHSLSELKF